MLKLGARVVSDAELLAVLLRVGCRGKTAVDIARELIANNGSLVAVLNLPPASFAKIHGLGMAKYASLQACLELGKRYLASELKDKEVLNSSEKVASYLRLWIGARPAEVFAVLFLNSQNELILAEELFTGTINQTAVYPREIVKRALQLNAAGVVFAHNHPSGCCEPSQADIHLTEALKKALATVDIRVLDHIIVSQTSTQSFAQRGLL
jgi:DNA repair protein RadC